MEIIGKGIMEGYKLMEICVQDPIHLRRTSVVRYDDDDDDDDDENVVNEDKR